MNRSVLGAGWPFAWLLQWYATNVDSALQSGIISKNGSGGGLLARTLDGTTEAIEVDCATPVFGVDGYPLSFRDLRIGDVVTIVKEQRGPALVTTQVHLIQTI